jgi:thymidylate kinase
MFSVALVGPDGAGKTTIGRRLERSFPIPLKYIYMGDNLEACNVLLPTTRLARAIRRLRGRPSTGGPPLRRTPRRRPTTRLGRLGASLTSFVVWANHQLAEEWFRLLVAWVYQSRGTIVVFDRHFLADYYHHQRGSLGNRIHGFLLEHVYPQPDLMILLDAPTPVLFARKSEGSIEALEARRQEYPGLSRMLKAFAVVDATQPADEVERAVAALITRFHAARTSRARQVMCA